jgi:hypothetical protein
MKLAVGVKVNSACPPGVPHPSLSEVGKPVARTVPVVVVISRKEFHDAADEHMDIVYVFPTHM